MAKPATHVTLYEFERCPESALRIHGNVRQDCVYGWESINEGIGSTVARKIVGLAFVGVIAGWEDFLESSFLRYMTGSASPSGNRPRLRIGPCRSISHARQIAGGSFDETLAVRRLQWSNYEWVEGTAKLFFEDGEPFAFDNPLMRFRIDSAFAIRNRIVHNSAQAKRKFKRAANRLLDQPLNGPLPRGFSPGKLLTYQGETAAFSKDWLEHERMHWGDLFEAYVGSFYAYSSFIVS